MFLVFGEWLLKEGSSLLYSDSLFEKIIFTINFFNLFRFQIIFELELCYICELFVDISNFFL